MITVVVGVFGLRLGEAGWRRISRRRTIIAIVLCGWRRVAVTSARLRVMLFAGSPIKLRQRRSFIVWLSRIAAAAAVRFTLADQAGQFGERIAPALLGVDVVGICVAARAAKTVIGHEICPVQPFPSTAFATSRPVESYGNHRISLGASTPSSASPEARTVIRLILRRAEPSSFVDHLG